MISKGGESIPLPTYVFYEIWYMDIYMQKIQTLTKNISLEQAGVKKDNTALLAGADGIRAIACLSVIFHHFAQKLAINFQARPVQELQGYFLLGNSGVSVFFVLSGFLLSYPFWKQYLGEGVFPSMKQYAVRRAARILPGYYVSFLICTLVLLLFNIPSEFTLIRAITGLTFTAGFHYVTFFPNEINSPFWSISFEVFCYFLMPAFMYVLYKLSGKNRSFIKALLYWVGVFVLVIGLNQLVHIFFTPDNIKRGWDFGTIGGAKYWMPNYNPVGFFGHFAVGIISAGISTKLIIGSKRIQVLKKIGVFDFVGVLCFLGSIALLWMMRGLPDFSFSLQNQPYYFPAYALLIGGILAVTPQSKWLGKILDNRFFRFTAKVSFGLYIWHYFIMFLVSALWVKAYKDYMGIADIKQWALICFAVLVVSYVVSALSFKFIEKPVLDRVHRRSRKNSQKSAIL